MKVMYSGDVRRILIIEDDRLASEALKIMLIHYGFSVQTAPTVEEALAALASKPDLILLDLMLPDGDGTKVLRRLRDLKSTSRVVVMTGTNDLTVLKQAKSFSPELFMLKPINVLRLREFLAAA